MTAAAVTERAVTVLFLSGLDKLNPVKKWSQGEGGKRVLELSGVPLFRSGTFRNSMGEQATWEGLHMSQMVDNFQLLQNKGTFLQAPVRKGHGALFSDPMDNLIGWVTSLQTLEHQSPVDGQTYTYLTGDYKIFDEEAAARIDNGDWPNRSAEVGTYVNNNDSEYWPMFMGFAYVDIPAVEGLNFSKFSKDTTVLFDNPKEFGVTGPVNQPQPPAPPTPSTAGQSFSIAGAVTQDYAAVQSHINSLEEFKRTHQPAKFSLRGVESTDSAAVQAHISTLEEFQAETNKSGRSDFVSSLASGDAPKIGQAQVESLTQLALGMNDEQFSMFKTSYEALPANPLFAVHGAPNHDGLQQQGLTVPGQTAPAGSPQALSDRYSIVKEMVAMHQRAGKSQVQLEAMSSYKEMKQLEAAGVK